MFNDFSGTNKIYLLNELPKPTSLPKDRFVETEPNIHVVNRLSDKIPLHITNMIVKRQIRCTIPTLDLLFQTAITENIFPVIPETIQDQLLLIEILQLVIFCLHTKKLITN